MYFRQSLVNHTTNKGIWSLEVNLGIKRGMRLLTKKGLLFALVVNCFIPPSPPTYRRIFPYSIGNFVYSELVCFGSSLIFLFCLSLLTWFKNLGEVDAKLGVVVYILNHQISNHRWMVTSMAKLWDQFIVNYLILVLNWFFWSLFFNMVQECWRSQCQVWGGFLQPQPSNLKL